MSGIGRASGGGAGGAGQIFWNVSPMPDPVTLKLMHILSKLGIKTCKRWDPYQAHVVTVNGWGGSGGSCSTIVMTGTTYET